MPQDIPPAQHDGAAGEPKSAAVVKGCRGQHGEVGAEGVITLRRPAHQVFTFLTSTEKQPLWNKSVLRSEVVRVEGPVKHVSQVMRWCFLALKGDFHMGLAMREDHTAMQVDTVMTDGAFMRRFSSRMVVRPLGPDTCCMEMRLFMQPSIGVPFGVKSLVGVQVRRQLHGVLNSLKDSVEAPDWERQHGLQRDATAEARSNDSNVGNNSLAGWRGHWRPLVAFAPAALMLTI